MRVRRLLFLTVAGLVVGVAAVIAFYAGARAQPAKAGLGDCQSCHADGLSLPAKHPKTKGVSIVECAGCHTSKTGQAKPQPFASRLHRAHVAVALECTTCHTYAAGKEFGVIGRKGNLFTLDDEQYDRVRKSMETWASSSWLAAKHGSKNISCGACHQKQLIPDDNETILNKQCGACHGGYTKVAAVTKAKLKNPNINPHASHLGPEIACTVCHQGHQESKVYCVNCHTNFNMPIPGGADNKAAK